LAEIRIKMRFDYLAQNKANKLFGNKNLEQLAEDTRQQKISTLRNVPIQGIRIEDIEMSQDIYTITDDIDGRKLVYAPVVITFMADSIEDVIKFVIKEEFRTVEVIEPQELHLNKNDLERLLFKISEELSDYRNFLIRKIDNVK